MQRVHKPQVIQIIDHIQHNNRDNISKNVIKNISNYDLKIPTLQITNPTINRHRQKPCNSLHNYDSNHRISSASLIIWYKV